MRLGISGLEAPDVGCCSAPRNVSGTHPLDQDRHRQPVHQAQALRILVCSARSWRPWGLAGCRRLRESFALGRPVAQREAHALVVLLNARSPGSSELCRILYWLYRIKQV